MWALNFATLRRFFQFSRLHFLTFVSSFKIINLYSLLLQARPPFPHPPPSTMSIFGWSTLWLALMKIKKNQLTDKKNIFYVMFWLVLLFLSKVVKKKVIYYLSYINFSFKFMFTIVLYQMQFFQQLYCWILIVLWCWACSLHKVLLG